MRLGLRRRFLSKHDHLRRSIIRTSLRIKTNLQSPIPEDKTKDTFKMVDVVDDYDAGVEKRDYPSL